MVNRELLRIREQMSLLAEDSDNYKLLLSYFQEIENCDELIQEAKEIEEEQIVSSTESQIKSIVKMIAELRKEVIESVVADEEDSVDKVTLEIKAASGGVESALFAEDMLNMYKNYCDYNNFDLKTVEYDKLEANGKKGCKSGKFEICGDSVYKYFKNEAGVHKVQRVPVTETKGRVHSSTIQVAILKRTNHDYSNFVLNEKELKYEFMRASGAGGQHVNKTDSACRVTHLPTGISVVMQDSREQFENKLKALELLKEKINNAQYLKHTESINEDRKKQTGRGNLSEKIRTYNYPDSRVTDHRLGMTKHGIEKMMEGDLLNEFVSSMIEKEKDEFLRKMLNTQNKKL